MESTLTQLDDAPMIFCERCNNLLYPESGKEDRVMRWRCNYCKTSEIHDENKLVYILNLKVKTSTVEELELLAEFANDPTAQRDTTKQCPRCAMNEVTCFVNPLGQPHEDMTLYFACANQGCRHVWKSSDHQDN
ncbi:DNA-direcetd RNA polymerase II, subunit 9, putative [Trypanosoma equiperdum]|uniref:DNA-direcetd RNA polymerase II, subunit 9, putative n=4 Tax=Trypanozoon TaxID=39700 RepID=Q384T7_TRYB2|nr:DNA-direcetd RNA polymerase II, subunit 9,putative [Trypanosoma brucei gambiense DAL972]XP_828806.1 DNA-direcetd RNA polymerase II subunit 9 [Trypanosoma brucei brucei TREU927]RHW67027.1 DNA-direcetd RNA polymerase II [Trypanosoma brucei equiperdum]SCU70836.1 DNA-direcetd RNA polymerase II, subunit 9, putative [Trypanosoma equiperdum]EAN79694.1 DNA-direcetd RNA polymerase II, subunit 9, putative [Trypanosoma brucei brucei TREU927]CBH17713.1 DNA-direcetd RNA polymerase II, subunit 9,putative|eukprot:XP_011779977.1 DNA-direcetd RNA polymerase II, subunit 9,putative [Trypanosoma brucei gambiense DAL972]